MSEPTLQEAFEIIAKYPTEVDYVMGHIKYFLNSNNDPDDNSIELAEYWQECNKVLTHNNKNNGSRRSKNTNQEYRR